MAPNQASAPSAGAEFRELRLDRVPKPDEVAGIAGEARRAWGQDPATRLDIDRICRRLAIDVSMVALRVPDGGAQGFLIPRADGRFKTEMIEPKGPWKTVSDVELATLTWVDWFNHRRLHGACGDIPPVEFEANYMAELSPQ